MRVILVGTTAERADLRHDFERAGFDIVAEFATLSAARASEVVADAVALAAARDREAPVDEPITPRELQVLELLAEGLSNKAIAARLGISDQTVKFHVAAIIGKLGAQNRTDAARRAIRRGLITL